MKTIQRLLRELDSKEIEDAFFAELNTLLREIGDKYDEMTLSKIKATRSEHFQDFLRSLFDVKLKYGETGYGILFLAKSTEGMELYLAQSDEIYNAKSFSYPDFHPYDFTMTPREATLAYLVSYNELTQNHLVDVAAKYLFEISFYGYNEDDVKKEAEKLNRQTEEPISEGKPIDELWHEFEEEHDLLHDEDYPREDELEAKISEAIAEYDEYCRGVELERIWEGFKLDGKMPPLETVEALLDTEILICDPNAPRYHSIEEMQAAIEEYDGE